MGLDRNSNYTPLYPEEALTVGWRKGGELRVLKTEISSTTGRGKEEGNQENVAPINDL